MVRHTLVDSIRCPDTSSLITPSLCCERFAKADQRRKDVGDKLRNSRGARQIPDPVLKSRACSGSTSPGCGFPYRLDTGSVIVEGGRHQPSPRQLRIAGDQMLEFPLTNDQRFG